VSDVSVLSSIPLSGSPSCSPSHAAQRQTSHPPGFQWCFSLPSTCLAMIATFQHCCAAVSSDISTYKSSLSLGSPSVPEAPVSVDPLGAVVV
jgi:hypothetical protein